MAGKRVDIYQSIKTVHSCRLYSEDYRTLFNLPKKNGKCIAVRLDNHSIEFDFEVNSHKYINHKLTGGK